MPQFENDVKMYGTETYLSLCFNVLRFENDVKMYGTETIAMYGYLPKCLRMM